MHAQLSVSSPTPAARLVSPVAASPPAPSPTAVPPRTLSAAEWRAFHEGYEFSYAPAMRLARNDGPYGMAEDLVSDAKVRMVDALTRPLNPLPLPPSKERFCATFLTIVHRAVVDDRRRWKPRDDLELREARDVAEPEPDTDDGNEALVRQREDIVMNALTYLTFAQIDVIMSTFWDGESRGPVAAKLGISPKTYDTHLRQAYERLRGNLVRAARMPDLCAELKEQIETLDRRRARREARERARRATTRLAAA